MKVYMHSYSNSLWCAAYQAVPFWHWAIKVPPQSPGAPPPLSSIAAVIVRAG